MKTASWTEYFHLAPTDDEPHFCEPQLCPKGDGTCEYWQANEANPPEICDHNKRTCLPCIVMRKPIFRDLANPLLLERCLHGSTPNKRKSLNAVIWLQLPKRIFLARNALDFATYYFSTSSFYYEKYILVQLFWLDFEF